MKTECIFVDARGAVAARHTAAGCNPSLVGPEMARKVLVGALQTLLAQAQTKHQGSKISAPLLCMAGSNSFWREAASDLKVHGTVTAVPDSLPGLELATGGAPGLVLHAGTGSFVAARAPRSGPRRARLRTRAAGHRRVACRVCSSGEPRARKNSAGCRDPQSSIPCGVSGILLNRPPCLDTLRAVAATQAWPVQLQPITDPPIEGVRRLLLKME
jgi:hypothetical protein